MPLGHPRGTNQLIRVEFSFSAPPNPHNHLWGGEKGWRLNRLPIYQACLCNDMKLPKPPEDSLESFQVGEQEEEIQESGVLAEGVETVLFPQTSTHMALNLAVDSPPLLSFVIDW